MKFYLLCVLLMICITKNNEKLTIRDIDIFKNTVAWDLAKAVQSENIRQIKNCLKKNPSLVNFQDPIYGTTLLMWAVPSQKFASSKQLLESEANPNIISKIGTSAFFEAISYPWSDNKANSDQRFVELLLKYKADPNINFCAPKIDGQTSPIECGTSLLMYSISMGFDKTRLLVEAGAEINYSTKSGATAAQKALLFNDVNTAYYLIVNKKAIVSRPFYYYSLLNDTILEINKPFYPVDLLLDWVYDLGSEKYLKKMSIVEIFKNQGIDYNEKKKNISTLILRNIKKLHPNDWQTYIERY